MGFLPSLDPVNRRVLFMGQGMATHRVKFLDSGREPQVAPNPKFPNGMDVVEGTGVTVRLPHPEGRKVAEALTDPGCIVELPYPSPRCGALVVTCVECGKVIALTVAGRTDDVRWFRMACKGKGPG
jgi:hypothetical protein